RRGRGSGRAWGDRTPGVKEGRVFGAGAGAGTGAVSRDGRTAGVWVVFAQRRVAPSRRATARRLARPAACADPRRVRKEVRCRLCPTTPAAGWNAVKPAAGGWGAGAQGRNRRQTANGWEKVTMSFDAESVSLEMIAALRLPLERLQRRNHAHADQTR